MRLLEKTYIQNLVGECEYRFKREHSKENILQFTKQLLSQMVKRIGKSNYHLQRESISPLHAVKKF